jgi:hypothetical protein
MLLLVIAFPYLYLLSTSPIPLCSEQGGHFKWFSPNKLLRTCNMFSPNKIVKNIYFKYFKTGPKVVRAPCYRFIAITLRYILRHRITLYHIIEKLSLLNFIAFDVLKLSLCQTLSRYSF